MENVEKVLNEQEQILVKNVSMADIGTGSNQLRSPLNLAEFITTIRDLNTPLYNTLRKVPGFGQAVTFNLVRDVYSSGDSMDASYADGNLPAPSKSTYGQVSYEYKQYGSKGRVTGLAMATMEQYDNLKRREITNRIKFVLQRLNRDLYWGKASDVTRVIGLDELITTNVIDAAGNPLSKALIDEAALRIAYRGGMATHMFVSPGVKQQVDNLYNNNTQVVITRDPEDQSGLTYGNVITAIQTVAGTWSVIADPFVNPPIAYPQGGPYSSSSGHYGVERSTVFIIAEPYLEISELKPMIYEDLAKTSDAEEFMVKTYVALALYAEPFCAKIINVDDRP